MSTDLGNHLFTFAVISDSHVNEAEDRSASPYPSNKLANGRFRYLVRALQHEDPAFTVHLGDMANPLPELATYEPAVRRFQAIAGALSAPLHLVPGNHCVGDKPTRWVPVPRVCEESLEQYERYFGRYYYSFDHGPCHFAALNSLLVNSGLEDEEEQRRWLEGDLGQAREDGKRIWILMHYPLYVAAPAEPGSYDNVDEPGRSWLLGLLERFGVEAAYSGHVHNYFYNRHGDTHMYTIPAASFVRQDYSQMFGVAPGGREGGRDDRAKLGYCRVKVYERGHVSHVIRTYGRTDGDGEDLPAAEHAAVHARERKLAPVGAEMRENWLSRVALMTNNSVSPFTRRWARNDWAVLALEEMGISRVRVFLDELTKEDVPERMADLVALGFEFLVYSHGVPKPEECDVVRRHRALISGWELIVHLNQIEAVVRRLAELSLDLPCYLNEVHDIVRGQIDDANVKHVANYGFQAEERQLIEGFLQSAAIRDTFRGLVFRLRRKGEHRLKLWSAIREISEIGRAAGLRNQVHILFSGNVTADRLIDNREAAKRVAEAALAAVAVGNVDVYFDTFEDIDRGYFVRNGLVDRRYNPRLAARVLRHLNTALAPYLGQDVQASFEHRVTSGRLLTVRFAERCFTLVLPNRLRCLLWKIDALGAEIEDELTALDLASGELISLPADTDGSRIRFRELVLVESPWLLITEVPARDQ